MRATDVIGSTVFRPDDPAIVVGRVADIAVEPGQRYMPYLLLELDDSDEATFVLLPSKSVAWTNGTLSTSVSEEDLVRCRVEQTGDAPIDTTVLPPSLIGPFGYTVSPALMGALANESLGEDQPPDPPGTAMWLSALLDRALFDASGERGTLSDIELEPDRWSCAALIVNSLTGEIIRLPGACVRNIPEDGSHLVASDSDHPPDPA